MTSSGWNQNKRGLKRFAISGLMRWIVAGYAIGYFLSLFGLNSWLTLNPALIFRGQIWRIVTFLLIPPASGSMFLLIFILYFYLMIGEALENFWGTVKFNEYYFGGVLIQIAAALLIYLLTGNSLILSTSYINMSLFLAFAAEAPDTQILLFFILPVKMIWLAWIDGIIIALTVIFGILSAFVTLPAGLAGGLAMAGVSASPGAAAAAVIGLANFFIYLAVEYKKKRPNDVQRQFRAQMKKGQKADVISFAEEKKKRHRGEGGFGPLQPVGKGGTPYRHRCAICGRTDVSDPDLEFRYCSRCAGNFEFCLDHIRTHRHVTEEDLKAGRGPEPL
ncbi:MAG: hypothetical protein LKG56_02460 [Lachnospiraceae bacterium]|jgi:hypothetical protein|nr:hypothetical protein [Lachnospiraceae bacterium]MCH4030387.1 hypothetical protein [Lachnospiraceae bacterium]MCH4069599.1 hypothetical protein [Lachnospiraceae bacterium]MCH4107465.1 hypothetical protein [Lachnospiraceae bacterium]MCI1301684.1 hypothetical protein [Lachnospiraceae bacterium]